MIWTNCSSRVHFRVTLFNTLVPILPSSMSCWLVSRYHWYIGARFAAPSTRAARPRPVLLSQIPKATHPLRDLKLGDARLAIPICGAGAPFTFRDLAAKVDTYILCCEIVAMTSQTSKRVVQHLKLGRMSRCR